MNNTIPREGKGLTLKPQLGQRVWTTGAEVGKAEGASSCSRDTGDGLVLLQVYGKHRWVLNRRVI